MQPSMQSMWKEYTKTKSPLKKQQLVEVYLGLVHFVVRKLTMPSPSASSVIEEKDLIQAGIIGLMDAIDKYDPSRGIKFETYAITRIRGSVLDERRRADWVPRSVRKKTRVADRVVQEVKGGKGTRRPAAEHAAELSISLEQYQQIMQETHGGEQELPGMAEEDVRVLQHLVDETAADPFEILSAEEARTLLIQAVERLETRQRLIITLYYYENLTFREIAKVLRISETRVFQIHSAVLALLRKQLKELR